MNSSDPLLSLSSAIVGTVEAAAPSVVRVDARRGRDSSGFVWAEGIIVTAAHTIERDHDIEILFADGSTQIATIVGGDQGTDVAVLSVEKTPPPLEHADEASIRLGAMVIAVGRDDDGATTALGVLSAVQGPWRSYRGGEFPQFLRPDINLNRDASGGPLVAPGGRVIGMNTWGLSRRTPVVIPLETIAQIVANAHNGVERKQAYLGIAMQTVRIPTSLKERVGSETGVIVLDLAPDGPAEKAGALLGDVLVGLGTTRVEDPHDVESALEKLDVGATVNVTIVRAGELRDLAIVIGEREDDEDEHDHGHDHHDHDHHGHDHGHGHGDHEHGEHRGPRGRHRPGHDHGPDHDHSHEPHQEHEHENHHD